MGFFIKDVPEAPGKPKVEEITSEGASLTWKPPPSDGGAPITEYKVQKRKRGDTKWDDVITPEPITEPNCKVPDLEVEKEYEFRIAAVNKAGMGPHSMPSDFKKYCKYPLKLICTVMK